MVKLLQYLFPIFFTVTFGFEDLKYFIRRVNGRFMCEFDPITIGIVELYYHNDKETKFIKDVKIENDGTFDFDLKVPFIPVGKYFLKIFHKCGVDYKKRIHEKIINIPISMSFSIFFGNKESLNLGQIDLKDGNIHNSNKFINNRKAISFHKYPSTDDALLNGEKDGDLDKFDFEEFFKIIKKEIKNTIRNFCKVVDNSTELSNKIRNPNEKVNLGTNLDKNNVIKLF
uniref:GOLD domain-containing protein n=1 Tax=Strongyloides papillosus TaxID=174720 RepID=A0A0N5B355_STREA